jgi:hypothetical protein
MVLMHLKKHGNTVFFKGNFQTRQQLHQYIERQV